MRALDHLEADLLPDEKIIWKERPGLWPQVTLSGVIGMIIFGTLMTSAFLSMGGGRGGAVLIVFWSAAFVVALLGSIWESCGTLYAITNKRLLIVRPSILEHDITSYYPWNVRFVRKKKRIDGSGSLMFSEVPGRRLEVLEIGFVRVRDVNHVEQLICSFARLSYESSNDAKPA